MGFCWDGERSHSSFQPSSHGFLVNIGKLLSLRKTKPWLPNLLLKAKHLVGCRRPDLASESSCFPIEDGRPGWGWGWGCGQPWGRAVFEAWVTCMRGRVSTQSSLWLRERPGRLTALPQESRLCFVSPRVFPSKRRSLSPESGSESPSSIMEAPIGT